MVNRPFPQYKKVNNLTSHLNLLNIKKTMTYDDGNPDTVHKKVAGLNLLMGSEPSCLHLELKLLKLLALSKNRLY
jgi:hypothetical protein